MKNKLSGVVLMFLLAMAVVLAENTTVTQQVNVSIVCNNTSQCVIIGTGNPMFFTAIESNVTVPVNAVFTYERNVTIQQNLTVVYNVTNYTLETHNVTVQNCDKAPVVSVTADDVVAGVGTSLVEACRQACAPAQSERDNLQSQMASLKEVETQCQMQLSEKTALLQTQQNLSDTRYLSLNESLSAQLKAEEEDDYPWMIVTVFVLVCSVGFALVMYYFNRRSQNSLGLLGEPELPPPRRHEVRK